MTKQTGLGDHFYIGGADVSGDVGVVDTVDSPMTPLPSTGIDKFAFERLGGARDGLLEFTCWFNDAAGAEHDVLSGLPRTDVIVSYLRGTDLGNEAASIVGKQVNYDPSRGEDGSLTEKVQVLGNAFGIEWGHNLTGDGTTGIHASSGAESLDGWDDGAGAATDHGLQVYFHLFAFTGTSVTLTIQDSDDDAATDPYATVTGATSGALTAPGAVRVATGRTENVKEWLRVTATGTYSAASFAVIVVRNLTEVLF